MEPSPVSAAHLPNPASGGNAHTALDLQREELWVAKRCFKYVCKANNRTKKESRSPDWINLWGPHVRSLRFSVFGEVCWRCGSADRDEWWIDRPGRGFPPPRRARGRHRCEGIPGSALSPLSTLLSPSLDASQPSSAPRWGVAARGLSVCLHSQITSHPRVGSLRAAGDCDMSTGKINRNGDR